MWALLLPGCCASPAPLGAIGGAPANAFGIGSCEPRGTAGFLLLQLRRRSEGTPGIQRPLGGAPVLS